MLFVLEHIPSDKAIDFPGEKSTLFCVYAREKINI